MSINVVRMKAYLHSWETGQEYTLSVVDAYTKDAPYFGVTLSPNLSFEFLNNISDDSRFSTHISFLSVTRDINFVNIYEANPSDFKGANYLPLDTFIPNINDELYIYYSSSSYFRFLKYSSTVVRMYNSNSSTGYQALQTGKIYTFPYFQTQLQGNDTVQGLLEINMNTIILDRITRINVPTFKVIQNVENLYYDATYIDPPENNPYDQIPHNDPENSQGNDGEYDLSSDPIPIPTAPTQGGTRHGFFSIFNPTDTQAQALATEFWSNNIIEQIAKAFYEPMSTILGFGIVPVTMPNVGNYYVKLGNYETNIAMPKVEQRYIDVNCGTIDIVEFIGAFLDYSPYTRMQMYLPFIGYVPLDTDLFMKHNQTITTMGVTYRVDILTGACTAFITANGNVYGQFGGNCLTQLPVTGSDYTRLAQALIGVATTAAGIGAQYQAYNQGMKQFEDKLNRKLDAGEGKNLPTPPVAPYSAKAHALSSVFDVISAKPNIRRGGSFAGAMGWLNVKKPHLLITLPIIDFPEGFNEYVGRPCNKITKLENVKGYTVVNEINLQGINSAYEAEIAEIDRLLKRGVIIK